MVLATFLLVDMFLKHINNHLEPKKMSSVKELKSYRLKFGKKKKNPADQKKKTHQIRIRRTHTKKSTWQIWRRRSHHTHGAGQRRRTPLLSFELETPLLSFELETWQLTKLLKKIMLNSKFPQAFPNSLPKWAPIQIYTPLTYTEGTNS